MIKKITAVLLIVIMLVSVCSAGASALDERNITDYPVIVVPGFNSTQLCVLNSDGTKNHVWSVNIGDVKEYIGQNAGKAVLALGLWGVGKPEQLISLAGEGMDALFEELKCNDNGTSKYPIRKLFSTAQECNSAYLRETYPDINYEFEPEIMGKVAEYIGYENIFNFNCDSRLGAVSCAKELDEFIGMVKTYTGKDKVNLIAVSHGGQMVGAYLTMFGYKNDIDNAVLTVPALDGAALAYDALSGTLTLDEENLMRFVESGFIWEEDYDWLLKAQQLGFLDELLQGAAPYFAVVLGNWISIWDLVPTKYYETLKAKLLDPEKNADIIRQSDYMHYQVIPYYAEAFEDCRRNGMNISVIAGYGNPAVSGLSEHSDAIITTSSATGAVCAPFGKRFSDGYTQLVENGRYSVSPSMEIDASAAYLPGNTWFVDGLYHGMTYKDDFTKELLMTLLLTDEITSVWSNPDYPQFHASSNPSMSVFARFDKSTEGFVDDEDNCLIIKNILTKYPMKILSVTCAGTALKFDLSGTGELKPGESVSVPFWGDLPEISLKRASVTVTYCAKGSPTGLGQRTFDFTIMNGVAGSDPGDEPSSDAGFPSRLERLLPSVVIRLLERLGLKELLTLFADAAAARAECFTPTT